MYAENGKGVRRCLGFGWSDGMRGQTVSRRYANARATEGGSFGSGKAWKLDPVEISDRQKAELDLLYREIVKARRR